MVGYCPIPYPPTQCFAIQLCLCICFLVCLYSSIAFSAYFIATFDLSVNPFSIQVSNGFGAQSISISSRNKNAYLTANSHINLIICYSCFLSRHADFFLIIPQTASLCTLINIVFCVYFFGCIAIIIYRAISSSNTISG